MDDPTPVSILILGDSGCGKSTFLSRLSVGQQSPARNLDHVQEHEGDKVPLPVLRDLDQPFIYNVRLHRRPYRLEFYDTSCVHQHWTLLQPDFVILAFDLTSREGLERLKGGYRVAQELRCDRYAECSAITGELIPEVFEDIATVAAKTTTEAGGQSKGGCVVM
ncbi:hypothetical protein FQN50_006261 [Emmonsiellopsis sp. PD_5]|nr:hypothetical protein FQN50_006261 [Emmonsiellopsis sp. PD_5]